MGHDWPTRLGSLYMSELMSELCVHDLVQVQASATPDSVALVSGNNHVTYAKLNARANQLAHRLRSLGIGPDVPVGLFMERSVELPIAALGILKAGGAYVPLDPTYPSRRLSMLLEDSGTPLVVTQPCVAGKLPTGKWETVVLDGDGLGSAVDSTVFPVANTKPENLAYIIFTSGSTGRPKGVQITHGSLNNLVSWHQRAFNVTAVDRATLLASPGFDAAVWEIWPYLAAGASLYVVDEAIRTAPDALRNWIVRTDITISFLPTALAENMIGLQWPPESAFRTLLTGADTLRRYPQCDLPFALVNNYGPTECTVVATSGRTYPEESSEERSHELPSIGRSIDGVSVYVVDEHLQRVPDGTAGELLIGGRGVGRGYLNAPELTAEKFLPDLFGGDPGTRLYRTGDLGRFLPDGQIAFMGRLDDQVKVMGHRIEPNEVVTVLNRYPEIEASFVCAYTDPSGDQRLVAYVVPTTDMPPKPGDLRSYLGSYLPSHMLPSAFVQLTQLPLSAHGKLDRAALPQPTTENILRDDSVDDSVEAPQSPIEEHLTVVLSDLLSVPRVGSEDNFFTLGGHSLMGAQLIAKIRESFGVELSLRTLFDEPTPRGMSAEIERLIHARLAAMSEDEAQRLVASSGEGV